MKTEPAKRSHIIRRNSALRPHRRPKASLSRIFAYLIGGIGDRLYFLGTKVERSYKRGQRYAKKRASRVFSSVFRMLKAILGCAGGKIASLWNDVFTPFRKIWRSFKSLSIVMKNAEQHGAKFTADRVRLFFKYGWLWNKYLVTRLMNYLAPLVMLAVCILVVTSTLNLNYAIEINYNGQTVGYVENEAVYDSARKIIQSKMINNDDQEFWEDDTTMRITVVDEEEVVTQDVMADNLLNATGDIVPASGVYIGGMFYGASAAPDLVNQALDALKAPYITAAEKLEEDVNVKFARDVEFIEGVYPANSVMPYEELVAKITLQTPINIYYKALAGANTMEIATKNGISRNRLQELNPAFDLNQALTEDVNLLVAVNEPLLRVKTVRVEEVTEEILYETKTQLDADFPVSYIRTISEGRNGEQVITYEYEYIDEEVVRTEISRTVIREPVNSVVIIGTKGGGNGTGHGTGTFTWPTADGYHVSRGWSPTHFGIDIAAPYGTSIYAADDGVVITATQMIWDYGIYIIVDHQNGYHTLYAHNSENLVQKGDIVTQGQVIALMGSTGYSTGNHVHFEVRFQGEKQDPAQYIG